MRTQILIAIFLGGALCLLTSLCSPQLASAQGLPGCPCDGGFDPRPPERFIQSDKPEPTITIAAPAAETKNLRMEGVPGRVGKSSRGYKAHCCLDATIPFVMMYLGVVLPITVGLSRLCRGRIERARHEALDMVLNYAPFLDARLRVRAALYETLATLLLWSLVVASPFGLL
ncbi:MAG: hypothetical protein U0105_11445 [Candidatus Obscuribacterales bacterium]